MSIKVNLRPHLEPLGESLVWQVPSQSEPGKFHLVVKIWVPPPDGKGVWRCSCTGFQMQQKCWHITKLQPEQGD